MHNRFPPVFFLTLAAAQSAPTVTVVNGTIQGGTCTSTSVNYFLSIPYAEPPVGDLRFAAPQPYNSTYTGVLQATKAAPYCIQFGSASAEADQQSEDCLVLDIWAPANATSTSKLPVKVWLYGGYNENGGISDALYNGCFSAEDAVVVSINYRLGPLGYLALESAGLTGNYGTQDQLLGLQWVQENIGAFGGDPTKVLLFGQSAGSFDTFVISTLPQAPSLIRAAAMESSGGNDFATIAEAEAWNKQFVTSLNCGLTDVSCLRSATVADLNATVRGMPGGDYPPFGSLYTHLGRGDPWGPLVDGKIIPVAPSQAGVKVPSIMGSATEEGNLFILTSYQSAAVTIDQTDYNNFLTYTFSSLASNISQVYSLSNFSSSPYPGWAAMSAVITDYGFRCPNYRGLTKAAQNGIPVWTYSFNHTPSCLWFPSADPPQTVLKALGPTHTSEIPFVFGIVDNLPPPDGTCNFTAAEKEISAFMMAAWTSMAAMGSPGAGSAWPAFLPNTSAGINIEDSVGAGVVDYSMCAFWDGIDAAVVQMDASGNASGNATVAGTTNGSGSSSARLALVLCLVFAFVALLF